MPKFERIQYLFFFLALLVIEVAIALFVNDSFVRPFLGDVLVVMLIYCVYQMFVYGHVIFAVSLVFMFACAVEVSQHLELIVWLGWEENKLARTILGSSFSWWDIVCYAAGCWTVIVVEALRGPSSKQSKLHTS